jgi:transposase
MDMQGKQTTTQAVRVTYSQNWGNYTRAQTNEVRLFDELLKNLVQNIDEPVQTFGRPRLSTKETVFCAVQKVYSQLSSRRAHSLYLNAVGKEQIDKAPNYNAVNKLLNKKELTPILHELISITARPLSSVESDFAVDSSGFRTRCFGQYAEQKYGLNRRHEWVKVHLACGVKTNIVTAVRITEEHGSDSPQFKELIGTTAESFAIREISADKAYSSRENLKAVTELGGAVYIPFRKGTSGKARGSLLWKKLYHYFQFNQEEFMTHYHKRSNVESVFSSIKKKFGDTLKSKNKTAQINEALCKILAYNITVLIQEMFCLGINPQFNLQ